MWLELTMVLYSNLQKKDTIRCNFNMAHVKRVVPNEGKDGCKLVLVDGETVELTDSYTYVKAALDGALETHNAELADDIAALNRD